MSLERHIAVVLGVLLLAACAPDAPPPIGPSSEAVHEPAVEVEEEPGEEPVAYAPAPWAEAAPEQKAAAEKYDVPVRFENQFGMRFVLIPAGSFLMGSAEGEEGSREDEGPQHEVTVPEPFYIETTEVTNGQYRKLTRGHRSGEYEGHSLDGDAQPAIRVEPFFADLFAGHLSILDRERTCWLPTEEQWEHACRAGTTTRYSWGDRASDGWRYANANDPATKKLLGFPWPAWPKDDGYTLTAPVASFRPNGWGVYDMHGNAWELCDSRFVSYRRKLSGRPPGALVRAGYTWESDAYVVRGGAWDVPPLTARSAYRGGVHHWEERDSVGFRLVSPLPTEGE